MSRFRSGIMKLKINKIRKKNCFLISRRHNPTPWYFPLIPPGIFSLYDVHPVHPVLIIQSKKVEVDSKHNLSLQKMRAIALSLLAVSTTLADPMTVFSLTEVCQGNEYASELEHRVRQSQNKQNDRAIVASLKKSKQSFQRGISYAGKGDWSKAALSFHLTRHLTQNDGVPSCYHAGAILAARGPKEALRVLDTTTTATVSQQQKEVNVALLTP